MRMVSVVTRAEKLRSQDQLEVRLDRLEKQFSKKETEFEKRLPSIAGGAKARFLHESHQQATSQPNRSGIGYGVQWVDDLATALSFGHTPDPKSPNPIKDNEWFAYRQQALDRLKRSGIKEVSCLTVMQESLPAYAKAQGLLGSQGARADLDLKIKAALDKAADSRGPGVNGAPSVYGGRATVLLEELRSKFDFQTVHIDALSEAEKEKYWNKDNYTSDEDVRLKGTVPIKKADVVGADTKSVIDTRVRVDRFAVLGKNMTRESRELWETIKNAEFAVGVADTGFHTFVISGGLVYEVHWSQGPTDPKLTEASPVRKFFKNNGGDWGSGVIALPPSEVSKKQKR